MGSTSGTNKISIFIQMIFSSFLYDVLVTLVYRRHNDKNVYSAHPRVSIPVIDQAGLSHQAVSAL